MRLALPLLLALSALTPPALATTVETPSPDPFAWLENVTGQKQLDWVRAQDARSLGVLQADPRYKTFYDQALALAQAKDRVPAPSQLAGAIYNFWQDAAHERGIWRRTTLDLYRTPSPQWTTVLDVDALAKAEHANWVYHGSNCEEPQETRCLVSLSDGGEDADTIREFDLTTNAFVPNGFVIPRAKTEGDWENPDSLLIATDWGPGSMTASGYPFIIKRLHRGQALKEAQEVFRGTKTDVQVGVSALTDGDNNKLIVIQEGLDFFHSRYFTLDRTGTHLLDLPQKLNIVGLVRGHLVLQLNEPWSSAQGKFPAGAIVSVDQQAHHPRLIFAPNARQSVEEVAITHDRLIAAIYDNVRGRLVTFTPGDTDWPMQRIPLPDNASVGIVSTTLRDNTYFAGVTSFLTPGSLWYGTASQIEAPVLVKQAPARFDASRDTVEQFETTSTDGTKIPYFVVHPKDIKYDGSNPTLLYAYGGFQVSELPSYQPTLGKLWLEHGGVYVLANIRGGGEFGPAWHEAAIQTKRQHAFDDFAAVAKDIIARKITSPPHLGIEGGSNGGLLMGVEFEQHPDLWNAAVIQVPLLDMLHFENIDAGASWVGEYGSVSNPEQRAFLTRISPYANLRKDVKYPTPFIYTTTKDDRVGPQHARKFAAKMESFHLPFLYYEAIEGGHGAGVNAREVAQEQALTMTYLHQRLMGPADK